MILSYIVTIYRAFLNTNYLKQFNPYLAVTILLVISCSSPTKSSFDKEAVVLNNRAVNIILTNPDSALILLDEATDIDSHYYVAYNNKVAIFCSKGNYSKAIEANTQALKAKPDLAEGFVFLGMLYDKTEQPDKAKEQYQKAIRLFYYHLSKSNEHEQAYRINKAIALLLMGQKTEGDKEVKNLLTEDSENIVLQRLTIFNKDKYLDEIFKR